MEREVLAELNPNMKMGNRNASRSGSTNLVEVHISNLEKDKGADVCIGDNDKGILINVDANEEESLIIRNSKSRRVADDMEDKEEREAIAGWLLIR